jgi:dihydropteroate synthase
VTDCSQDPIFGDVATRLAVRSFGSTYNTKLDDALPVAASVRADQFSTEEREALRDLLTDPAGLIWTELGRLRALRDRHPWIDVVIEPSVHVHTPPAPPRIMGIVNVTPDSFSDGGSWFDPARAVERGLQMASEGADLLDIGGESTRPGSEPVSVGEELRRVLPVVRGLAERADIPLSIDTTKAAVARECLAAGATIVNDVSGGRFEPSILTVAADASAGFVVMHMLGTPRDMQREPRYANVVGEVLELLRACGRAALEAGVERSKLWVDPGIGFGKALEHNLALLRGLNVLRSLGLPVVVGVSRKSFLASVEERAGHSRSDASQRLGGTLAALTVAVQHGAEILRVHDVREARQAALVARALAFRDDGGVSA